MSEYIGYFFIGMISCVLYLTLLVMVLVWRERGVHCRDCKFFNDFHGLCHRPVLIVDGIRNTRWVDGSDETEPICATAAKPDGFCAWGERREDG